MEPAFGRSSGKIQGETLVMEIMGTCRLTMRLSRAVFCVVLQALVTPAAFNGHLSSDYVPEKVLA